MKTYLDHLETANMVKNTAGGLAFAIGDWQRLDRFVTLGTEGGTYYATQRDLTQENCEAVKRCIEVNGIKVVDRLMELRDRVPKRDALFFVLALCISAKDVETRRHASKSIVRLCQTGTDLYHFVAFATKLRGWGKCLRRGVAEWYNQKPAEKLAYQFIKYQQRDGWSHKNLLHLSHPNPPNNLKNGLYAWVTYDTECVQEQIHAFEAAKIVTEEKYIIKLIQDYNLPREAIPTKLLNSAAVWEILLENMPYNAMTRNLGKMSNVGLLGPMSEGSKTVIRKLGNGEALRKSRLHPYAILLALKIYGQGRGMKGSLSWQASPQIVQALDTAFLRSFSNIVPTGKNFMLGVDVSASMTWGPIAGGPLVPHEAAAAMAMATARSEENYDIMGFSSSFKQLPITAKTNLGDALRITRNQTHGGTDCSLPMVYAAQNKIPVDAFVVYTDSETWCGRNQPVTELKKYRQKMGRDAKLIVVAFTSNGFSIADPNDAGMLDVVGFDAATPSLISDFVRW